MTLPAMPPVPVASDTKGWHVQSNDSYGQLHVIEFTYKSVSAESYDALRSVALAYRDLLEKSQEQNKVLREALKDAEACVPYLKSCLQRNEWLILTVTNASNNSRLSEVNYIEALEAECNELQALIDRLASLGKLPERAV